MSKLEQIRDRLLLFHASEAYNPYDIDKLLTILLALCDEVERVDKAANFKDDSDGISYGGPINFPKQP
jgi:hypothetical protein